MPAARKAETEAQLYNLRDDPAEQENLISKQPEVAARMLDLLSTGGSSAPET